MDTKSNRGLTRNEVKVFILSSIGGMFEFYDFVVYVFVATTLAKIFFPSSGADFALLQSLGVFAAGYIARVAGGILFSHVGDTKGRKKSFNMSGILMALPTLGIGLLPGFNMWGVWASILLVVMRVLQGLAMGGEIPCAITFIFEHAQKHNRGFAIGALFAGVLFGSFMGSFVCSVTTSLLSPADWETWGWRVPFLLGGSISLVGVFLRSFLSETSQFKTVIKSKANASIPLFVVCKQFPKVIFSNISLVWLMALQIVLFFQFSVTYFSQHFHYNNKTILMVNSFGTLWYLLLIPIFGKRIDGLSVSQIRRSIIMTTLLCAFAALPCFHLLAQADLQTSIIAYGVEGILTAKLTAEAIYFLALAFPTHLRTTGISVVYNASFGILGGLSPVIIQACLVFIPNLYIPAYYIVAVSVLAFGVFARRNSAVNISLSQSQSLESIESIESV